MCPLFVSYVICITVPGRYCYFPCVTNRETAVLKGVAQEQELGNDRVGFEPGPPGCHALTVTPGEPYLSHWPHLTIVNTIFPNTKGRTPRGEHLLIASPRSPPHMEKEAQRTGGVWLEGGPRPGCSWLFPQLGIRQPWQSHLP